jgi:hypothetical protein
MFNKKRKNLKCNHKWEARNCFIIEDKNGKATPRICLVCPKCNIAIHKRVYSTEELNRLEKEFFGDYLDIKKSIFNGDDLPQKKYKDLREAKY